MQLFDLFIQNVKLALQAVGGAMSIIPAIEQFNLMPSETLANLVVIGQASPGPNMLLIPLIGWQILGVQGALVATIGFCLPSAVLVLLIFKRWANFKKSIWKNALQELFIAIGAATVLLSTISFAKIVGLTWLGLIVIIITAGLSIKTKTPPILLILGGGIVGFLATL